MMSFSPDPKVAEQQMNAIIWSLTAFAFVDGEFDKNERGFIEQHIAELVEHQAKVAMPDAEFTHRVEVTTRWTTHFHEVFGDIYQEIRGYFDEPVADGENTTQFVVAKLKLRCFELFKGFDEENRAMLLSSVDALMNADGVVHPEEQQFRTQLGWLLEAPVEIDDEEIESLAEGAVVVDPAKAVPVTRDDHPFFRRHEINYSGDTDTFNRQADADVAILRAAIEKLDEQREAGRGRLKGAKDIRDFEGKEPFLDGHVYVLPAAPDQDYELLVLGDLHGCYTCLKAALLQVDFFGKVQAHHDDPDNNPMMKLVLLGDYIDRGRFSYNGILRTVLQLFLHVPEHVYVLRGNHEYYVELNGRVYGAVKPSEAMNSLKDKAPNQLFGEYMRLFDALPNMLFFDRTLFVHAGIPRDDTFAEKYEDLSSLNNAEIRFQMLWSDPSDADAIPLELQKSNARFPFGTKQFRHFMHTVGANTMIRGHEKINAGFKEVYSEADARLLNLFSAGGKSNVDLPEESSYRSVTPMALTIRRQDGVSRMTPFAIEYERYNDPRFNAFLTDSTTAEEG